MQSDTMTLSSKGPIRPVPRLVGPAQHVSEMIQTWPGIIAATHWDLYDNKKINGADFYVGQNELGHIHLDGEIHLATTKPLRMALIAAGLAEPFPWYDSWVQFRITDELSANHGAWLFNLNYDRLMGMPMETLMMRIQSK